MLFLKMEENLKLKNIKMTVKELKEKLNEFDENSIILLDINSQPFTFKAKKIEQHPIDKLKIIIKGK